MGCMMATDDFANKLAKLTYRQLEILQHICNGLDYQTIADELFLAVGTVKTHMGNIYKKLELYNLPVEQRRKLLFQDLCPALENIKIRSVSTVDDEPETVPDRIMKMVEEDERSIVPYYPGPLVQRPENIHVIDVQSAPPPRRGCRNMLIGILIGIVFALIAGFLLWRILIVIGQLTVTPVVSVEVKPTTTPEPELPTSSPIVTEIVLIVTATPKPGTPTLAPMTPAIIPPTDTPEPTIPLYTPTETVLEVGESLRRGNNLLTLVEVYFRPFDGYECTLGLSFNFENTASSPVIFTLRNNQFSLEDNLGNRWGTTGVSSVYDCQISTKPINNVLQPREVYNMWVGFYGDAANPLVDYVIVTIHDLLDFDGAKWRVPINN